MLRSLLFPDEFVLSTLGILLDSNVAIATMVFDGTMDGTPW
jgi:hypothetical protein